MNAPICPGCSGRISRGATLCRECRKRAIVAGVNLLAPGARTAIPPAPAPRTTGQNRAYHGKCGTLARLRGQSERETKQWALAEASSRFGRAIASSAELNEDEMSDVLDLLDDAITALLDEAITAVEAS
jgi:hypothetical protein